MLQLVEAHNLVVVAIGGANGFNVGHFFLAQLIVAVHVPFVQTYVFSLFVNEYNEAQLAAHREHGIAQLLQGAGLVVVNGFFVGHVDVALLGSCKHVLQLLQTFVVEVGIIHILGADECPLALCRIGADVDVPVESEGGAGHFAFVRREHTQELTLGVVGIVGRHLNGVEVVVLCGHMPVGTAACRTVNEHCFHAIAHFAVGRGAEDDRAVVAGRRAEVVDAFAHGVGVLGCIENARCANHALCAVCFALVHIFLAGGVVDVVLLAGGQFAVSGLHFAACFHNVAKLLPHIGSAVAFFRTNGHHQGHVG